MKKVKKVPAIRLSGNTHEDSGIRIHTAPLRISSNGTVSVQGIDILKSKRGQEQLSALKAYLDSKRNIKAAS